jgi:dTDP-4-amino-4,6-dideoxygalactose transaminase
MKVPLLDLKAQYRTIKPEIDAAVMAVLESQQGICGKKVSQLEAGITDYLQVNHAVGVSSGTDAILISIVALGIGPGDEVITTPYTFFATAGCIARTGARPVFVDICEDTYNINPDLIEAKVNKHTRAIIPVHLFGQPADMDEIMAIADKHGLKVIEDAAQAVGAQYRGKPVCTMGAAGTLSFFPSKNLGGIGDGGMVITQSQALYEKLVKLRNHGQDPKYYYPLVGGNFRLDEIQAAVVSVKLAYLESWSEKRRQNAGYYNERFKDAPVVTPVIRPGNTTIFNQYIIRSDRRDGLAAHLKEKGIGTSIYYPLPLHLQECFADLGYGPGDLPVSEAAAKTTLALPVFPELTDDQRDYVAASVLEFVNSQ